MWRVEHYTNGHLTNTSVWARREDAISMVTELNMTARRLGITRRAVLAY